MWKMDGTRGGEGNVLLAAGLLAALLVSCSRAGTVEVSAAGSPSAPVTALEGDVSTFQGEVTSIDVVSGEVVVAVQIVWTPVLKADPHERRVVVGSGTRWEPIGNGLASLHVGDPIQVDAARSPDGRWRARTVQLFDLD